MAFLGHSPRGHGPMHMRGGGHRRGHEHGHEHGHHGHHGPTPPFPGIGFAHLQGGHMRGLLRGFGGPGGRGIGHGGCEFDLGGRGFEEGGCEFGPGRRGLSHGAPRFPWDRFGGEERRKSRSASPKGRHGHGPSKHDKKGKHEKKVRWEKKSKWDKKAKKEWLKSVLANSLFPHPYYADLEDTESESEQEGSNASKNAFEVKVDVTNFSLQDLDVKTVNNFVVIVGKHEEKQDEHGFVSRSFTRRYQLPEGVNPEAVTCKMSSDGFLVVSAPAIPEAPVTNERSIPITQIGQTAAAFVAPSAPTVQDMDSTDRNDGPEETGRRSIPIATDHVTLLD